GGTGYTQPPMVQIAAPISQATAVAQLDSGGVGFVSEIDLTSDTSAGLASITVTNPGSNYSGLSLPSVSIGPPQVPGGTQATGAAVVNSAGQVVGVSLTGVLSINVTTGGSGYQSASPPVVHFLGSGTGATATAVVVNGAVTAINVTNPGSGFTAPPSIQI